MNVTRGGVPVAVITGGSRGSGLWPLSIDARVADAGQLAPWLPWQSALAGRARLTGELRPDAFAGDLVADLASATLMLGAPVTLTNVRAAMPLRWQAPAAGTAGTLEASTHAPLRFAARMAGHGVDLAAFVREAGVTIARATGRVDYVLSIQQTAAHGLFLAGRVEGAGGGGEIGIDALERLLASSTMDADGSGLLRRTLENLRTFRYEALTADVRLTGATGHVDVALNGRKRFGIFPGPVDAINLHRVPLDVLARTFAGGSPP
jgi:hypothetical protein